MKLFIAGASGQVARALCERAAALGVDALALGRPALDVAAPASIEAALSRHPADIVVNAAAYTAVDAAEADPAGAMALNAEAAGALAAAAAARGLPVIHLSTDYVFAGEGDAPHRESDPVGPLSVYGATKLKGERLVAAANSGAVIIRTSWVFSPFGSNFVKTMLRLASSREEVGVVADQHGAPTSAFDIADAILAVAGRLVKDRDAAPAGVFHFAGAGDATWADVAEATFAFAAEAGGPSARVRRITAAEYPTPARRPRNSRLDCEKIRSHFGVIAPLWRDSLRDCVHRLVTSPER